MNRPYLTEDYVQNLYKNRPGKLRFDPEKIKTREALFAWKQNVSQKAYELMQFPDEMYEMPKVRFLFSQPRDGYRIEKYEISPEPDLWVSFLLLVPDAATEQNKAPAVLCFPGWDTPKEYLCGEDFYDLEYDAVYPMNRRYAFADAMALHYVKQGLVVLASDNAATGEQMSEFSREAIALKLLFKGRNYVGLCVMQRWAMFRWLYEQSYVDAENIGISAHSLGTETTMFLALIEPRIKAVCHNDFMSDNEQRMICCYPPDENVGGGAVHLVPGFYEWFSFPDLIAAFAPKPILLTEGGVQADLERIAKAYEIAGDKNAYTYHHYPEFADPTARTYDHKPIPEGITTEEYFKYANVAPEHHFFKYKLCVPWMCEQLKAK